MSTLAPTPNRKPNVDMWCEVSGWGDRKSHDQEHLAVSDIFNMPFADFGFPSGNVVLKTDKKSVYDMHEEVRSFLRGEITLKLKAKMSCKLLISASPTSMIVNTVSESACVNFHKCLQLLVYDVALTSENMFAHNQIWWRHLYAIQWPLTLWKFLWWVDSVWCDKLGNGMWREKVSRGLHLSGWVHALIGMSSCESSQRITHSEKAKTIEHHNLQRLLKFGSEKHVYCIKIKTLYKIKISNI